MRASRYDSPTVYLSWIMGFYLNFEVHDVRSRLYLKA